MKISSKIYITSLVFLLLCLIFAALCVWMLKGIEKNSRDLISAKNKIVTLKEQISETKNFKKNYDAYRPNFDRIDQMFFDSANPVNFIKFLENTADGCKITSQISLPPISLEKNQISVIFQFFSKGSFSNILDFSKKIELGPYLIEIQNLTIQNTDEKTTLKDYSQRQVNATFTIKVFIKTY